MFVAGCIVDHYCVFHVGALYFQKLCCSSCEPLLDTFVGCKKYFIVVKLRYVQLRS